MMTQILKMLFNINYQTLKVNTDGISHRESLIHPHPGGNCMNWVLGHILVSRNDLLQILGEAPVGDPLELKRYERGSKPLTGADKALLLEKLMEYLQDSQFRLTNKLDKITEEELAETKNRRTVAESLAGFHFHEAYHCGQVGLLRRLAGKEGAIK